MGVRAKYIKRSFHLAFLPSPWPLKHRIERARMTCYLRRIFLRGFWFNEGFPSCILFLKIHETGLKSQLILFLSGVSWNEGQDLLSALSSLACGSSPERGLAITQIHPLATTPQGVNETQETHYAVTLANTRRRMCVWINTAHHDSLFWWATNSSNKLCHLTVKMQSVCSQSGGKLMLYTPYHTDFHKVYKGYVWRATEQLNNMNTMIRNNSYMKYRL